MAELNPNAKKWVEALRSGKYQQGKCVLSRNEEYCCLGVACEVAIESGVSLDVTVSPDGTKRYNNQRIHLPEAVREWLGLHSVSPLAAGRDHLTDLNDHGSTFSEIADVIESQRAGLFVEEVSA